MATISRNPTARLFFGAFPRAVDVTTDQTIHEGDMVWWDSVNGTLKPCTASTTVPVSAGVGGFCGVAAGRVVSAGRGSGCVVMFKTR